MDFQSAFPDVFPPSWAETWGDDEYGLYADLVFSSDALQRSQSSPQLTIPLAGNENIVQRFRWIAAGTFTMGSPPDEFERYEDEDCHQVTLAQGYWLADTVVTQIFWEAVFDENPSAFNENGNNPIENVSWNYCQRFLMVLNRVFSGQLDGSILRLPTEAEWEHACRAGVSTPFSFGENINSEQVNFDSSVPYLKGGESKGRGGTVAVKLLPANQWGLYEMHGNVWEWCADGWQKRLGIQSMTNPYYDGFDSARRVHRGGSWGNGGRLIRSAFRSCNSMAFRADSVGFRISIGSELRE